ncbi:hypothetical protein [uncultured Brevibacillus sp.]|uniref:hypothetical protein n=1 Tax=uncultured Brevibacillus sp. TaxID=169970 RepID=UPI0025963C4A|nr:hypothetical protein [uncultured Brevibacillus sp.]
MDGIHIRIGHNLQRVRKQRQLSLDKMADLTADGAGASKVQAYERAGEKAGQEKTKMTGLDLCDKIGIISNF